jgi:hypothetical protein
MMRLSDLAEEQWGLITRREAEAAGISQATITRLASSGVLDRVAHGVYRLAGSPPADHQELRAAWLQLDPETPIWERRPEQGVVSHRSAAALYGIGHLPADRHEFILPRRRQTRRPDVRLHVAQLQGDEWILLHGMPTTRPSRIAADMLTEREDPEAVGYVIADAIREMYDYPGTFVGTLAPYAARFRLRKGDGMAVLRWLLGLVSEHDADAWLAEAAASEEEQAGEQS